MRCRHSSSVRVCDSISANERSDQYIQNGRESFPLFFITDIQWWDFKGCIPVNLWRAQTSVNAVSSKRRMVVGDSGGKSLGRGKGWVEGRKRVRGDRWVIGNNGDHCSL